MQQTLFNKLVLLLRSSRAYINIVIIGLFFIGAGMTIIWGAFSLDGPIDRLFMIIFGGFLVCLSLFFMIYTLPSTVIYYYNKELAKKYGRHTKAKITKKEIIDNSYYEKKRFIEEMEYLISFAFEYRGQSFENSDFVGKEYFESLKISDSISIKYLITNPKKALIVKKRWFKK